MATDVEIKRTLEKTLQGFSNSTFMEKDPISIPHRYTRRQDIEISAFWTALLAWGQRTTILQKSSELFALMDDAPFDFVLNHDEKDRIRFSGFRHRTFQYTDTLYFLEFLQFHYRHNKSLEDAFLVNGKCSEMKQSLVHFNRYFFQLEDVPDRTRKHVASPASNSSCKRLNMFLRWMVRSEKQGPDFGLWKRIQPAQLMIPLDVHVGRVSRAMGLLKRKQDDWKAVEELTEKLRTFDPDDPVKYDLALFSLGIASKEMVDKRAGF